MAKPHFFEPLLRGSPLEWRLLNRTRGVTLARRVETAFDSHTRRTGLLGRPALDSSTVLAIAPSNAIHTFRMQFPLDVLFVSRDGRVLKRVLGLKPGRIALSLRAFAVLEFAASHPGVAETAIGDLLCFEKDGTTT